MTPKEFDELSVFEKELLIELRKLRDAIVQLGAP